MLNVETCHPGLKDEMCIVTCPSCERKQRLTECKVMPSVKSTIYKCINGCRDLVAVVKKHSRIHLQAPVGMNIDTSIA